MWFVLNLITVLVPACIAWKENQADGKGHKKGTSDNFYKQGQLLPEKLEEAARGKGKVKVRWQVGYDHSYFTMATFADDHVNHAARYLLG